MFKYSRNWLSKLVNDEVDYKDFDKNWLDIQGFEVATEENVGDDEIIELEVKANRPDMLSHLGVMREYYVYKNRGVLPNIVSKVDLSKVPDTSLDVKIATKDVGNVTLIEIRGLDNTKSTPPQMVELLENLGVKSISPLVDIANYIMLEVGQPIHIYDLDKLGNKIAFENAKANQKITTLNGEEVKIPEGSITITDGSKIVCLAGIIGTKDVEVTSNTKNILIESADFDAPKTRIACQNTHVNTIASYRFERGIDSDNCKNAGCLVAEKVMEICGGKINSKFVIDNKKPENKKIINITKSNKLIGINITAEETKKLLESYYYTVKIIDADNIEVICPRYRLDLELDVDIIADIAQIYGYQNITPTLPNLCVEYEPNTTKIYSDKLREMLLGIGLNECISYTFIHENSMQMMGINKESPLYGDIKILNPLSNKFAIMRPNMLYSMISTYIYNLSHNGECEPIFEIGSTFYKDKTTDTGYNQSNMLAVLLNGARIQKGFGIDKEVAYDFYDIKAILELIASEWSIKIELKPTNETIFKAGMGAQIFVEGKPIG